MTFIEKMQPHRVCDISNKMDDVTCGVYHFDCNDPAQNELIARFTKLATKQRHFFYEIFPWKSKCNDNWHMFIAVRQDPRTQDLVICAWCSVRFQDLPATDGVMHKTAYIVEVSVRRKKTEGAVDESYRGMGIKLLQKIIEYSNTHGVSILHLVPSNETVKGLYMSSLEMSEVPETSYLVKSLSDSITVPMMIDVIGLKRANEIAEETMIFKDSLRALPKSISRFFSEKTDSMQLDDKVAILGEIELMMEGGVPEKEVMEYINEL
jgi:GNAT superfamily N-acetyltransferase